MLSPDVSNQDVRLAVRQTDRWSKPHLHQGALPEVIQDLPRRGSLGEDDTDGDLGLLEGGSAVKANIGSRRDGRWCPRSFCF